VVNIYTHAFTFWHRPGIEPGTFDPKLGHSDHYSTTPSYTIVWSKCLIIHMMADCSTTADQQWNSCHHMCNCILTSLLFYLKIYRICTGKPRIRQSIWLQKYQTHALYQKLLCNKQTIQTWKLAIKCVLCYKQLNHKLVQDVGDWTVDNLP